MRNLKILISGAGVAGLAAAHWLGRYAYDVTIVERAATLRAGGQAIDLRGTALDVADRMGVLEEVRGMRTRLRGMTMVDGDGKELFRSDERTFTGGDLNSTDVEILRDDLCRVLHRAAGDRVRYVFDDSITGLNQDEREVRVTFEKAPAEAYDLVVGADGLHSTVRRLAFGPEARYIEYLGRYLAVFTAPNFLGLDNWQVYCQSGDILATFMSARDNAEARVYLGFCSPEPLDYDYRDVQAHKHILADRFAGAGWEFPRALKHMWKAEAFHFDPLAQIHMDDWSRGRVVLLGDAGYCGSPMSGQGTSMAVVGAYVLAGELKAAGGDHRTAFAAYHREMRDFVAKNQAIAHTAIVSSESPQAARDSFEGMVERLYEVVGDLALKDY
jgi:2-polyprenyl-6-methoxyphenol hydroxylase-like FAD-dependent oxidoreductase